MTAGFGAVPDELRQTAGKIVDAIGDMRIGAHDFRYLRAALASQNSICSG